MKRPRQSRRPAAPDGGMREELAIAPGVSGLQLPRAHVHGAEDGVGRVVEIPVGVQKPALLLQLTKQRRARIRREDVKRCAFEAVGFDPVDGAGKDVFPIMVQAQHEAAVDLDAVVVKEAHAAGIVLRWRRALAGIDQVLIVKRLEPDEHACATGQRHVAHQRRLIRHIDGNRGRPDDPQLAQHPAQPPQIPAIGAEIVVGEDDVGLLLIANLRRHALDSANRVRLADPGRGEIAERAAVVAAARGVDAGGGQKAAARENLPAWNWREVIGGVVVGAIDPPELPGFDVPEDSRPDRHAVADGDGIGVCGRLIGTGSDVQAAENDDGAALTIPTRQLIGAAGKCQMHRDADDLRKWLARRRPLEQVLIPVAHAPVGGRGGRDAGQSQRRRKRVPAETRPGVFAVERVDQQRVAQRDGIGIECRIESRRVAKLAGQMQIIHGVSFSMQITLYCKV